MMGDAVLITTVAEWRAQHQGHDVKREVVHVIKDDVLMPLALGRPGPPAPEISLHCRDCGESIRMDLG